jgi:hypothetical protein
MINKIKMAWNSRQTYRVILESNQEYVVDPFFHGIQMDHRIFGAYIFVMNSPENESALRSRSFVDFKDAVTKHVNWELEDEIYGLADKVLYDKKHNLLITMISEAIWKKLNTAINIAERTDASLETRREIIINAYNELSGVPAKPKEQPRFKRNRYTEEA